MESLVLSLISSYLKDFVNNFRREQISVNFLRGHGVIKDLDINVDAVNEIIFQNSAPSLRFQRILINTLSISAPIMSLKSKPIVVYIDELFVEIGEVVDIPKKSSQNSSTIGSPPKKSQAKYGFLDRITDSISFEINKIHFALKTLGRLKTSKVGPWTPPVLLVQLTGNRFFCTNNNGVEAELDECLRVRLTKRPMLFVYKKFESKNTAIYLVNPEVWFPVADEILSWGSQRQTLLMLNEKLQGSFRSYAIYKVIDHVPFNIGMAMRKRIENNLLLGLELTFSISSDLRISLKQCVFSEILHFLFGLSFSLFRKDVVEEMYGPNPHNEQRPPTSVSNAIGTNTSSTYSFRPNIKRDQLEKEALASLDRLEAEVTPGTAVEIDVSEKESRGLWNTDDDPPHLRFVIAVELYDCNISLVYDDSVSTSLQNNTYRGADIHFNNFVVTSIWPEKSTITESILQYSLKSFSVTEFSGTKRVTICRSTLPLDHNEQPIVIDLLPRGVKEYSHNDPETFPGICFIYRKDSNWPPPPVSKGVAAKNECAIGHVDLTINLDSTYNIIKFLAGSWNEKWISGDWNAPGRLETVHSGGSSETAVVFHGVTIFLYSDFSSSVPATISSVTYSDTLIPAHIILDIELISFMWKHNLDLKIMSSIIGDFKDKEMLEFPHKPEDLSQILKRISPLHEIELLSDRLEVSLSQISLKFLQESSEGMDLYKTLIRPFSVVYLTSIDPHPDRDLILPSPESFFNPYNRVFYWSLNSTTISSTFLAIENFALECSLLDITRMAHIFTQVRLWKEHLFPNGIYSHPEVAKMIPEPSNSIILIRANNIKVSLIEDEFFWPDGRGVNTNSTCTIDDRLRFECQFINFMVEWKDSPPLWNSEKLVGKCEIGKFSVSIKNMPACFVSNESMEDCLRLAWHMNSFGDSRKIINDYINDKPVISLRFESNIRHHENRESLGQITMQIANKVNFLGVTQPFEKVVEDIVHELLHGHGIIHSDSDALFDNCILGYWLNFLKLFGINLFEIIGGSHQVLKNSHLDDDTNSVSLPSNESYLQVILKAQDFECGVVDPFQRDNKFVSINISIQDLLILGRIAPSMPQYFKATLNSHQKLLLYQCVSPENITRMDFSTQFMSSMECKRNTEGIFQMGMNMALQNLYLNIDRKHFTVASEIISRLTLQMNKSTIAMTSILLAARNRLLFERTRGNKNTFMTIVEESENSKVQESILAPTSLESSSKNIIVHLLNSSLSKPKIDITVPDIESKSKFSKQYFDAIRSLVKSSSSATSNLHRFDMNLLQSIKNEFSKMQNMFTQLLNLEDKIRQLAIMSGGYTVIYSGYVRRSSGFSQSERSILSGRSWAMLTCRSLHFAAQPYAETIDFEINLSNKIEVRDPDEGTHSSSSSNQDDKHQLSTKILFCNKDGFFIFDCCTLDEKHSWLELLKQYRVEDSNSIKKQKKKSRFSLGLNLGGIGHSSSSANLGTTVNESSVALSSSEHDISNPSEVHGGDRQSRFKSAAKGVLKALSISKKSSSSKIPKKSDSPLDSKTQKSNEKSRNDTLGIAEMNSDKQTANVAYNDILSEQEVPFYMDSIPKFRNGSPSPSPSPSLNLFASPPASSSQATSSSFVNFNAIGDSTSSKSGRHSTHRGDIDVLPTTITLDERSSSSKFIPIRSTTPIPDSNHGCSLPANFMEILDHLSEVKEDLLNFQEVIENFAVDVESSSLKAVHEYELSHDHLVQLSLGLFGLENTIEEVTNMAINLNKENESKIQILSAQLQTSLQTSQELSCIAKRALNQKHESESVLEACTMQNINTVMAMSKQYDELMELYNALRYGDTTNALASVANIHELVKNLTSSLREMEKLLKESEEREDMLTQEMDSLVLETEATRQHCSALQERINTQDDQHRNEIQLLKEQLALALAAKDEVEQERNQYQHRYESLLRCIEESKSMM